MSKDKSLNNMVFTSSDRLCYSPEINQKNGLLYLKPIKKRKNHMKNLETDLLVVGAGTAGMAATVAAGELGTDIIVLERLNRSGGTANMASSLFAVESRLQRVKQLPLTKEDAFKIYMDFTHWRVNAPLVRALINKSADTIDWLEKMGVEFAHLHSHGIGNNYTQHTVKGEADLRKNRGPAAAMMKILNEKARDQGSRVFLKTTVHKIFRQGGKINGVAAKDSSGEEIRVDARAIILATGGFSSGTLPGQLGRIGDGISLAGEIGASVTEINKELAGKRPEGPVIGFFSGLGNTFWQPGLIVNLLGERFMNEEIVMGTVFERNAIHRQKNGTAYVIFDEDTKNHYVDKGFDFVPGGAQVPIIKANDFDEELRKALEKGSKSIFVADSLEELADKTGIDSHRLRETVDRYNRACDTGRDDLFDKKTRYLRPVRQPKFYAGKKLSDAIEGWSGIRINHKTEVLTDDYKVIPGLYAAGMDVASEVYHDSYPMVLPATAMGFAVNGGRIAGENAALFLKSIKG